ncbi:MAG: PAS domain S-box protein [Polyangiaceae bacterium]|nr:PAS domain S-box protein [Polyangiaceae bacterium]
MNIDWLVALYERSPIAIGFSRDGVTLEVNARYLDLFGHERVEELRGRSVLEQIAPAHRDEISARIRSRRRGDPQVEERYESHGLRADGKEFPIALTVRRVVLADGPLTVAIVEDLTERHRTQAALADALELRRSFMEASGIGLLAYRESGACVLANDAVSRLVGGTREQLTGQNFRQIPSWAASGLLEAALEALESGQHQRREVHLKTTFGMELWVDCSLSPFWSQGERHLLLTMVDTTERVMADRALRAAEERSRAEREHLDQLRDQFLSIAAHELRTPVTVIKTHVQLMERRAPGGHDEREGQAFAVIRRQCDRLNRLVQDLLEVSRLQLGRMTLQQRPIELASLIEKVIQAMHALSERHPLKIEVSARPHVRGDAERIEQVMMNLLDNAIRYSPQGGEITVQVRLVGDEARVEVTDQGLGIPAELQPRIFERFFRAHAGSSFDYGGLGVGLNVSKSIVELHAGRLWFESQEGSGSTFHLALPLEPTPS